MGGAEAIPIISPRLGLMGIAALHPSYLASVHRGDRTPAQARLACAILPPD